MPLEIVKAQVHPARVLLGFCLVLSLISCGGAIDDSGGSGAEAVADGCDCGNPMGWDSDGDGVSDRVEAENESRFMQCRCDDDPSEARGEYDAGSLHGGINLPDTGDGYARNPPDPTRPDVGDWATLELLACIEMVGRKMRGDTTVHIGDLSRESGGEFMPHVTHQNGLEIEVRYARNDGLDTVFDIRRQSELYDPVGTRNMFLAFVDLCRVDVIFADVSMLEFTVGEDDLKNVEDHPDRRTHFLVRLEPRSEAG